MEKLQSALEKARRTRVTPTKRDGAPDAPAQPRKKQLATWQDLQPFEPDEALLIKNRVLSFNPTHEASQFDIMRTKILLQMQRNNWRRIAITSPTSSCGKSTLACNMIAGLSRQSDMRSILFDLDLRQPKTAHIFGAEPEHDISDVLCGKVDFADQAFKLRENAALSCAKRAAYDPAHILLQDRSIETLEAIEKAYAPDIMIFDLPPFLVNDDARAFLKNVDCALIVIKAGMTTKQQIDVSEKEVAEYTNVLGVVLNQFRSPTREESYESY